MCVQPYSSIHTEKKNYSSCIKKMCVYIYFLCFCLCHCLCLCLAVVSTIHWEEREEYYERVAQVRYCIYQRPIVAVVAAATATAVVVFIIIMIRSRCTNTQMLLLQLLLLLLHTHRRTCWCMCVRVGLCVLVYMLDVHADINTNIRHSYKCRMGTVEYVLRESHSQPASQAVSQSFSQFISQVKPNRPTHQPTKPSIRMRSDDDDNDDGRHTGTAPTQMCAYPACSVFILCTHTHTHSSFYVRFNYLAPNCEMKSQ